MVSAAMRRRGDEPTLDFAGATPYVRYGGIDTLLGLQETRSGQPAETGFLITTQVMELLFSRIRHEWVQARDALDAGDVPAALAALRRGTRAQDVLVESWDLLAALTPTEFNAFREHLGEASGFQSYTYRELEFLLGHKRPEMLRYQPPGDPAAARLEDRLRERSLVDHFYDFLATRGVAIPAELRGRDVTLPSVPSPEIQEALVGLYRTSPDVSILLELMTDFDEGLQEWRYRHVKMVERTIGTKPGTGGSSGAEYLRNTVGGNLFPDLWEIRAHL